VTACPKTLREKKKKEKRKENLTRRLQMHLSEEYGVSLFKYTVPKLHCQNKTYATTSKLLTMKPS